MITSRDNAQVRQVCAYQKKKKERDRDKVFVAEGERLVLEAPADALKAVYVSASYREGASGDAEHFLRLHESVTQTVSDEVYAKMSEVETPQGILAVVEHRVTDREQGIGRPSAETGILLILDGIRDPGNLGTIFRSAEAAGCAFVLMSADTADLFSPKAVRATMGSIYRMPCAYTEDLAKEILSLRREKGYTVHAAQTGEGAVPYDRIDYTKGAVAFVIGNEGSGIRADVVSACDGAVVIPMAGKNESLNAAVSASVLLFEAARQRR
ncbi:MAG: RNA methyltransferase [Lachnospiraceae bacterium]|nr:RNA methyltransferase [Lachnospiraceae bacterium]